jgi:putative transposase
LIISKNTLYGHVSSDLINDFNREALWIEGDISLPAERVVRVLETLLVELTTRCSIRMNNRPELNSQRLESWAKKKHIKLLHIHPSKLAHNAYIERGLTLDDIITLTTSFILILRQ